VVQYSEVIRAIDEQILKWIQEVDELSRKRSSTEESIHQLEEKVERAKEVVQYIAES